MILYIAGQLPCRSETFVYNEVLALRDRGVEVAVASVHPPERDLGDERLDGLAGEAAAVYGQGAVALLADSMQESVSHPRRAIGVMLRAIADACLDQDCPLVRRPKVVWQSIAGLALARRVRRKGIRHIHAHMAHVPTTVAMYAARQLGVPFSFTGHAADLFPQRTLLATKLRRASFVACISEWHRAFYQEVTPDINQAALPIVRCGVTLAPAEASTQGESETDRLISVGRLIPKKGFDTLIRAVSLLRKGGADVQCDIIGGGPHDAHLRKLIEELGVGPNVRLLGPMDNHQIRQVLPQATLFVLPCQVDKSAGDRDGIPVALMEAMASRVCVITGRLSPIDELVRHRETGWLVTPGDAEELAEAIFRLLEDQKLREQLAEAGFHWVRQEFERDVNIERLIQAFGIAAPRNQTVAVRFQADSEDRDLASLAGDDDHTLRPAVFLDRDGTLIEDVHYLSDPADVRIVQGGADAVRDLRHAGYRVVVVSNQSAVGRGMIDQARLDEINDEMCRQLAEQGAVLDAVYSCTVAPRTEDRTAIEHPDRKPGPGMLLRAAEELRIDLARSWMAGDMISDVLAGRNAGCRMSILLTAGGRATSDDLPDVPHEAVPDLPAAASLILERAEHPRKSGTPGGKSASAADHP